MSLYAGLAAYGLCESCTATLSPDGICRRCRGCDYGQAIPDEVADEWRRDAWGNGVVMYVHPQWPDVQILWICDLAGKWSRDDYTTGARHRLVDGKLIDVSERK